MRPLAVLGLIAVLLLSADVLPLVSHFQDTTESTGNQLKAAAAFSTGPPIQVMTQTPVGFMKHSSVWDGSHVYTFGGQGASANLAAIYRYDPVGNTVTTMGATLPAGRAQTSAVWTGNHAYIFGGISSGAEQRSILRYEPSTDTLTDLGDLLPQPLRGTSAVWSGTYAYIFGGYTGSTTVADILRFDPGTNTVTDTGHDLPSKRYATAATWDGTNAHIFGGWDGPYFNSIIRYTPGTGAVTTLPQVLPTGREFPSAIFDGADHWIFGGRNAGTWYSDVVRFRPSPAGIAQPCGGLPTARDGTAAVWTGDAAFVTNGGTDTVKLDQVVRFRPSRCLPVMETLTLPLPTGREGIEGIWHNGAMYIVGGYGYNNLNQCCFFLNEILKFDPAANTITKMNAVMPHGVQDMAVVSDGTYIYIFGGCCGTSTAVYRQVLRFDPVADTITSLTSLPVDHRYSAASWHGDKAYLFGQYSFASDIRTFHPASGTHADTGADIPSTQQAVAAEAVHGGRTFLFGGCCGTTNLMTRYTVSTNTVTSVGTMPIFQYWMEAETVGDFIYVFGGWQGNLNIYRFDPATNAIVEMAQDLPSRHGRFASAVDPSGNIYIAGGLTTTSYGNQIRIYRPYLDAPL